MLTGVLLFYFVLSRHWGDLLGAHWSSALRKLAAYETQLYKDGVI